MPTFSLKTGLVLLIGLVCRFASADEPRFQSGKALEDALQKRITWSSVGIPLREQLRDFSRQAEVAIMRDRRLDPNSPVTMDALSVSRTQVLQKIVSTIPDVAFVRCEQLVYIGSSSSVGRLPILLSQNNGQVNSLKKKIGTSQFKAITSRMDVSWPRLSEPREIILRYAKNAGVVVQNPDAVPHDVWSEQSLPTMRFDEIATIILNQFDFTFQVASDSASIQIVPINFDQPFEFRHQVGSKLKPTVIDEWKRRFPGLKASWSGATAMTTAKLEQHSQLNAMITELNERESPAGKTASSGSVRTTKFQLKAESATVGQLVEYFRSNGVMVEVIDAESPETKAVLAEIVKLSEITDKLTGEKFFPLVFGKHFTAVEVLDDRVRLSRD